MRSMTHLGGGGGDSDGDPCAIVYVADLVEQGNKKPRSMHGLSEFGRLLSALAAASGGARVNEFYWLSVLVLVILRFCISCLRNAMKISKEIILA